MSASVANGLITLHFGRARFEEKLPDKADDTAIQALRDRIAAFGRLHCATKGQINAAFKALTDHGYYVRGPLTRAGRRRHIKELLTRLTPEQKRQLIKDHNTGG